MARRNSYVYIPGNLLCSHHIGPVAKLLWGYFASTDEEEIEYMVPILSDEWASIIGLTGAVVQSALNELSRARLIRLLSPETIRLESGDIIPWHEMPGRKHVPYGQRRRLNREAWTRLLARYGVACLNCGRTPPEIKLVPDHVVPVSRGGADNEDNLQPLCQHCNTKKGDQIIDYRGGH